MRKFVYFLLLFCTLLTKLSVSAQETNKNQGSKWSHDIEGWFYIMKDDFIFSPVYAADKGWLHLEARYNYEDINTFSGWLGYNFNGGNKFQYAITPMFGALVGNLNGIAPGLEFNFQYFGFELDSESEYIFDLKDKTNDYFYNWTDLSYAPLDWLWFGVSLQKTEIYKSDLEIQFGPLIGGSYKCFDMAAYVFNVGSGNSTFVIALSLNLPGN